VRQPPPVSVRCSGGLPWQVLNSATVAVAAAALAAWIAGRAGLQPVVVGALAVAAAVGAALAAWAYLHRQPPVDLVWDGQAWRVGGMHGTAGALEVAVDAGRWMLLHLRPDGGGRSCWLPVAEAEAAAAWHALRVAAFASAGRSGDPLVAAATGAAPPGR
jgi:hypothetical protein